MMTDKTNEKISPKLIAAILATGILNFAGITVETAMNITFPILIEQFNIGISTVQWMTTLYLLVVAATVPISSFLKRRFTLKKLFIVANLCFIAIRQLTAECMERGRDPQSLTEDDISRFLYSGSAHFDVPDPDLIIRTSGEERMSNFLTWQAAYSELMFTDTLWPDFTPEEYAGMVDAYANRDRRFGGRKEKDK